MLQSATQVRQEEPMSTEQQPSGNEAEQIQLAREIGTALSDAFVAYVRDQVSMSWSMKMKSMITIIMTITIITTDMTHNPMMRWLSRKTWRRNRRARRNETAGARHLYPTGHRG